MILGISITSYVHAVAILDFWGTYALKLFVLVSNKRLYVIHVIWFDWFLRRKGDSTALQQIIIHVFIAFGQILKRN